MFDREIRLVPTVSKEDLLLDISFCYPGSYEIGMAGLGFQLVWWLLEQDPEVLVRRCFEDVDERGLTRSDFYGFTLSWELDFVAIAKMLDKYGLELDAEQREEEHPIVFGGGPVLSANPEPYAYLFDLILLGDAEATIPSMLATAKATIGMKRLERLQEFAKVPGLYVPSLYQVNYEDGGPVVKIEQSNINANLPVVKQVFKAPPEYIAKTQILSPDTTWGATYLLEVVRSCPQECRFCLASYLTRPFRFAPADTIIGEVLEAKKHTEKIGLLGPSITEHPDFDAIAERLSKIDDLRVNVASVRADTLSEKLVRSISKLGQKSVTIALESGSQRLRDIMKKNLSEEQIFAALNAIEAGGLKGVKFYGIAGLPYEEQNDLDETVRLLSDLKKKHSRLRFVFGLSSFVPKAQTPFQRCGRDRRTKKKMEFLRKNLAGKGIDVRTESHNWSDIQALLSRGDRRLKDKLIRLQSMPNSLGSWKKVFKKASPSFDFYVFDNYPEEQVLAWDHLMPPERQNFLDGHLVKAEDISKHQEQSA